MTNIRVQKQNLGVALKKLRREAKLNQTELALMADVHRNAVVAVEAGRGNVGTLHALANAMGMEVSGRALPGTGGLGQRLHALRKRRRLGRRAVAALADISVPAIEGCERGEAGHIFTLEAFGRAVGAGLCLVPTGTSPGFWESTAKSSADMEWYTPTWVLDRVIDALGEFDTDPCSPGKGKSNVRAALHFTVREDGLRHAWPGAVWMNPPYGKQVPLWLAKARHEVEVGHARSVIALIAARSDTRWWADHAADKADIVMLKGRITFEGAESAAPFPSAILAYGLSSAERDRLFAAFPESWHIAAARLNLRAA